MGQVPNLQHIRTGHPRPHPRVHSMTRRYTRSTPRSRRATTAAASSPRCPPPRPSSTCASTAPRLRTLPLSTPWWQRWWLPSQGSRAACTRCGWAFRVYGKTQNPTTLKPQGAGAGLALEGGWQNGFLVAGPKVLALKLEPLLSTLQIPMARMVASAGMSPSAVRGAVVVHATRRALAVRSGHGNTRTVLPHYLSYHRAPTLS